MIEFELNGVVRQSDSEPDTPLLWVLRDELGLTGTKFGCGKGLCGACTVHLEGSAVRSCSLPVASVAGRTVTTIEAFAGDHPLQQAWIEFNVPQCGYCQSGQIMAAAALLASGQRPDREQIRRAMSGNLCRCGTYNKIQRAVAAVAAAMPAAAVPDSDITGAPDPENGAPA